MNHQYVDFTCPHCKEILLSKDISCFVNGTMYWDIYLNNNTRRMSRLNQKFMQTSRELNYICKLCGGVLNVNLKKFFRIKYLNNAF